MLSLGGPLRRPPLSRKPVQSPANLFERPSARYGRAQRWGIRSYAAAFTLLVGLGCDAPVDGRDEGARATEGTDARVAPRGCDETADRDGDGIADAYEGTPDADVRARPVGLFENRVRPAASVAPVFRARIVVAGTGVARLDERTVYIIVPPESGVVLI
jgi:hypothetical protein